VAAFGAAVATAAVLDSTGAAQDELATPIVIAPAIAIATEHLVIVLFMVISFRVRAPGSAANFAPAGGCRRVENLRAFPAERREARPCHDVSQARCDGAQRPALR
jgi:hypothetical protein